MTALQKFRTAHMLQRAPSEWRLLSLRGQIVEISGAEDSASLTVALGLVREAQLFDEPVAWVTREDQSFYPPDAAEGGVDLDAVAVVRVPGARALARAADHLARSGAFGLLVLDVADAIRVPAPVLSRLRGLAHKHGTAIVFLTLKRPAAPSLGSLVSLRAQTRKRRTGEDAFTCELRIVKDKRRAPGWGHAEVCRGPSGMH